MFGIQKRYFHGNAEDRCLGSKNSSTVILTEVSTVTTKGSLLSNGRVYKRGLHSKVSLALTSEERSLGMTVIEERSLALTAEESTRNLAGIRDS
jgi:hypothetical protein